MMYTTKVAFFIAGCTAIQTDKHTKPTAKAALKKVVPVVAGLLSGANAAEMDNNSTEISAAQMNDMIVCRDSAHAWLNGYRQCARNGNCHQYTCNMGTTACPTPSSNLTSINLNTGISSYSAWAAGDIGSDLSAALWEGDAARDAVLHPDNVHKYAPGFWDQFGSGAELAAFHLGAYFTPTQAGEVLIQMLAMGPSHGPELRDEHFRHSDVGIGCYTNTSPYHHYVMYVHLLRGGNKSLADESETEQPAPLVEIESVE